MIKVGNVQVCDYGNKKAGLCVEPAATRRKVGSWVMWVYEDGSAVLYTQREDTGAVVGNPIELSPNRIRNNSKSELKTGCKVT